VATERLLILILTREIFWPFSGGAGPDGAQQSGHAEPAAGEEVANLLQPQESRLIEFQ